MFDREMPRVRTAQDIEDEHNKAWMSITPEQWIALRRCADARRQSVFNNRHYMENLRRMFAREADACVSAAPGLYIAESLLQTPAEPTLPAIAKTEIIHAGYAP